MQRLRPISTSSSKEDSWKTSSELDVILQTNRKKAQELTNRALSLKNVLISKSLVHTPLKVSSKKSVNVSHGKTGCTAECQQLRERLKEEIAFREEGDNLLNQFQMTADLGMRFHREQMGKLEKTYKDEISELMSGLDTERERVKELEHVNAKLQSTVQELIAAMYAAVNIDDERAEYENVLISALIAENKNLRTVLGVDENVEESDAKR
eukprot:CFRG0531T1